MNTTAMVNRPTARKSTQPLGALVSETGTTGCAIALLVDGCGDVVGATVPVGVEVSDGASGGAGSARPSVRCPVLVGSDGLVEFVGWCERDGGVDEPGGVGGLDEEPGLCGCVDGGFVGGGRAELESPPISCPTVWVTPPTTPVTEEIVPLSSEVNPPSSPPSRPGLCCGAGEESKAAIVADPRLVAAGWNVAEWVVTTCRTARVALWRVVAWVSRLCAALRSIARCVRFIAFLW